MNSKLRITSITLILLPLTLLLISPSASANPVAVYLTGSYVGDLIVITFFVNLLFDTLILILPLMLLYKLKFEKKPSKLWTLCAPLLAVWGAYIDMLIILTGDIVAFYIGLGMIFLTFFIIVTPVMQHRIASGLTVGITAACINALSWYYLGNFFNLEVIIILLLFGVITLTGLFFMRVVTVGAKKFKNSRDSIKDAKRIKIKVSAIPLQIFFLFIWGIGIGLLAG